MSWQAQSGSADYYGKCMVDPSQSLADYLTLSDEIRGLEDGPPNAVRQAFRDLLRMLNDLEITYAMFGAFAMAAYVTERRSTLDIDVVARTEHLLLLRQRAAEYGFDELPKDPEAVIRSFMHRNGVRIDLIFDDRAAFVDLDHTLTIDVPRVGRVVVADIVDVAFSKLRTQRSDWKRNPRKRAQDYADLVAMIGENPDLAESLARRLFPPGTPPPDQVSRKLQAVLRQACIQAEVPPPQFQRVQFAGVHWGSSRAWLTWTLLVIALLIAAFFGAWLASDGEFLSAALDSYSAIGIAWRGRLVGHLY